MTNFLELADGLTYEDIIELCEVNNQWREECTEDFWRRLTETRFVFSNKPGNQTWKEYFAEAESFSASSLYLQVAYFCKEEPCLADYYNIFFNNQSLLEEEPFGVFFLLQPENYYTCKRGGILYFLFPVEKSRRYVTEKEFVDFYNYWLQARVEALNLLPLNAVYSLYYGDLPGYLRV